MSQYLPYIPAVLAVLAAFLVWRWFGLRSFTVYEFQKGLLYANGKLSKVLGAGRYTYVSRFQSYQLVDTRKTLLHLPGQDILTRDNVNIKLSVVGFYQIVDPAVAMNEQAAFVATLHNLAQIELRKIVGQLSIDELLASKSALDDQLQSAIEPHGTTLGLALSDFAVRDILLPANLKRAFAGLLEAQKEAQRQLEKARGEQAVLRNLANAAKVYENNPMLLQARLVQALSEGNNSIVFKPGDGLSLPVPPKSKP